MGSLGTTEIIFICLVILVLFGAKRIPEFMQGLGKGVREFKKAARDAKDEIEAEANAAEKKDPDKKLQG